MLPLIEARLQIPTPVQRILSDPADRVGCTLSMKRDDLIHPHICGNKWRKLKYNFANAFKANSNYIISSGGPYSNHLVAVAAAGYYAGVRTVGIIRSYKGPMMNPTISILRSYNMKLEFVQPARQNLNKRHSVIEDTIQKYSGHLLIPEGGTNELSMMGVEEMINESVKQPSSYSHIIVAIGTGGTLAGIIRSLKGSSIEVIGVSPFKGIIDSLEGFKFLNKDQRDNLTIHRSVPYTNFGAYDEQIVKYIVGFYKKNKITLDPVYTAKAVMTTEHLLNQNYFPRGSNILIIHSGGVQGIEGYAFQYRNQLPANNEFYEIGQTNTNVITDRKSD